jgi:hypothetical protein
LILYERIPLLPVGEGDLLEQAELRSTTSSSQWQWSPGQALILHAFQLLASADFLECRVVLTQGDIFDRNACSDIFARLFWFFLL